ncbi:MAG: hypothetical protein WBM07_09385 [Chitinivibrionales bacterium]
MKIKFRNFRYGPAMILMFAASCAFAKPEIADAVTSATPEHHEAKAAAATDTAPSALSENAKLTADLKRMLERQYASVKMHKRLAYATAALVLATDIEGTYHFLNMEKLGHRFRDSVEAATHSRKSIRDPAIQAAGIRQAWLASESQSLRVVHDGLVAASAIAYTATATIELTVPRLAKDPEEIRMAKLHRNIFYLHAGLMAANIALGCAESRALSQGNHNQVVGFGIAHMIIGFSLPVIMVGSGLVFHAQPGQ